MNTSSVAVLENRCWKRLLDVLKILLWTQMQNKIMNAVVRPLVLKDLWCRKAEGPFPWTPAVLSSANPRAVPSSSPAAPVTALQNRLAMGTSKIGHLGGKALWSIPCAHREVGGSTALLHGQLSKGERRGRVARQCQLVSIIASMTWLLHFKAGCSLLHSSPPLPLLLKDFEKVLASFSQCFPPQNWNVIAGKEVQEKQLGTSSRQDAALKLHHFSEFLPTWLRSHTDLCETWLTLCSRLNESETVRQGLNSVAQFYKVFPGFVIGMWGASIASVFWL